jgi:UDP-N-acetylmuramyl pentapeptide phosphotransferase/UDP-N-acetylglucosamine-1-phosphate transferase
VILWLTAPVLWLWTFAIRVEQEPETRREKAVNGLVVVGGLLILTGCFVSSILR